MLHTFIPAFHFVLQCSFGPCLRRSWVAMRPIHHMTQHGLSDTDSGKYKFVHQKCVSSISSPKTGSPISINPVILGHTKAPLLMERGNTIKHLFHVERKLPFSTPRFFGSLWWTFSVLCSTVSPLPFFPSKIRMEKRPIWEFFDWHLAAYTGEAFLGIPWKQHRTCIIQSWRHRKKDERSC